MTNETNLQDLPTLTVCNTRSLFPKINNFKQDFIERQVDFSLICEIWESTSNDQHLSKIKRLLELDGLKYISTPRPKRRGGGAAILCNLTKFRVKELPIQVPKDLEVIWALARPKMRGQVLSN